MYNEYMMKKSIMSKNTYVQDENDPVFREHILRRAAEAENPHNRLPLSELKKRLAKRSKKLHA